MNNDISFKDKLSALMFLNIKPEVLEEVFKTNRLLSSELFLPIRNSRIASQIDNEVSLDRIPVSFFVEGMFFVLGADKDFKYNSIYTKLLNQLDWSKNFIKKNIYEEIKCNNLEEAYIMLKGLCSIEKASDNYDKLLLLCDELRHNNNFYENEIVELIEMLNKERNYYSHLFYDAVIKKEKNKLQESLQAIDRFLEYNRNENQIAITLREEIQLEYNLSMGKELCVEQPEKALKLLIPILEGVPENATLYYYIAKAYRNLDNYEKAIYYLNDAISLDNALLDVINELGLNYAALGMYEEALKYFRKAFDSTKSVEICTNIIACYLQLGDMAQAELHLEIAKKLNPEDDLILTYEKLIKGD